MSIKRLGSRVIMSSIMILKTKLGKLILKNPVILASGTFDKNIAQKIDINQLGGLVTKTTTLKPRVGNPLPRIIKTKYGFINSDGWKNPGIYEYLKSELPFWQKFDTQVIPSIGGETIAEYAKLAEILAHQKISAIEVSISCPNVEKGGMTFGKNPKIAGSLIKRIRKKFRKTLIVKLAPNVTDICEIAGSVLKAGADVLTIANTYLALEIDNQKKKPKLHRIYGGYSGPAIKPLTLRIVRQIYQKLKCPIIASGGVVDWQDALDYFLVGASAAAVGSANYYDPATSIKIIRDLDDYFKKHQIKNLHQIKGVV